MTGHWSTILPTFFVSFLRLIQLTCDVIGVAVCVDGVLQLQTHLFHIPGITLGSFHHRVDEAAAQRAQHSTSEHSTVHQSTAQYIRAQYIRAQHSRAEHSTSEQSTAQ